MGDRDFRQHRCRYDRRRGWSVWSRDHAGRNAGLCGQLFGTTSVSVIATATNTVSATVPVGTEPRGLRPVHHSCAVPRHPHCAHGTGIGATPLHLERRPRGHLVRALGERQRAGPEDRHLVHRGRGGLRRRDGHLCGRPRASPSPPGRATWWIQWWGDPTGYGTWSQGMAFTVSPPSTMATLVSPSGTIGTTTPTYTWQRGPRDDLVLPLGRAQLPWPRSSRGWRPATAGCGSGTGHLQLHPEHGPRPRPGHLVDPGLEPGRVRAVE